MPAPSHSPNRPTRSQLRLVPLAILTPPDRHRRHLPLIVLSRKLVGHSDIRDGRFQPGKRKGMVQGTIQDSLVAAAQTLRSHRHNDLRVDEQEDTSTRNLKGLKRENPPPKKQTPSKRPN
jgi:hypothetical protein